MSSRASKNARPFRYEKARKKTFINTALLTTNAFLKLFMEQTMFAERPGMAIIVRVYGHFEDTLAAVESDFENTVSCS
jgi:hypothetical protein